MVMVMGTTVYCRFISLYTIDLTISLLVQFRTVLYGSHEILYDFEGYKCRTNSFSLSSSFNHQVGNLLDVHAAPKHH